MYKAYKKPFLKVINLWGKRIHDRHFTEDPIYIGGCGRSGTTLLLSILSSHKEIFACPHELGLYHDVTPDVDGQPVLTRIDRLHRTFIRNTIEPTANRWCEKSPSNVKYISTIDQYHDGKFKFIHIVRDGRDVVLSKHPTSPDTYWVDPDRWVNDVTAGYQYRDHANVYTVRYEDLITQFDTEIKGICTFLGIPLSGEIINWHDHTSVKRNRAYDGNVKEIFSTSIQKWKKTQHRERAQHLVEHDGAMELLKFYGYEL